MNNERKKQVELNLASVPSPRDLHDLLKEQLGFPAFYGKNWDAFHDAITGMVEMPQQLIITEYENFSLRFPHDWKIFCELLQQMNRMYPGSSCEIIFR